jgi:Leucine-rich repeat (LRR) protein
MSSARPSQRSDGPTGRSCTSINISSTRVTDAGMEHLKGLSSLKELDLSHTGVSQAGVAVLKALTGLQSLELDDTRITDAEVEELRKAMPNATIYRQVLDSRAR